MGQMAKGITLGLATLIGNFFVASGERNRLEAQEADGLGIIKRELDDAPHLLIIDAVHDSSYRNDIYAGLMQVMDGAQLHVKQIANLAVGIGCVADSVKLQVSKTQACFGSLAAKFRRFGKLNSVGSCLNRVVSNLTRVTDGIKEVRRERRLAT